MTTYTVYLGTAPIFCGGGTEYAYEVYTKTKELAELIGETASLVWDENGDVVADFDPYDWDDDDYELDVDECGFDPYEGCYTGDC